MQTIAFTGSRKGFIIPALVSQIARSAYSAGHSIIVGCANGVDAVVRHSVPTAKVFKVASPNAGSSVNFAQALARRSMSMVQHCTILVGFASVSCPSGVSPAHAFGGHGSGTWASVAYAVSKGKQVFIFKASGVLLPCWPNGHWVQAVPSGVWSQAYTWQASSSQLSLL